MVLLLMMERDGNRIHAKERKMPNYAHNTRGINAQFTLQPVKFLVQTLELRPWYRHYYPTHVGSMQTKTSSLQHLQFKDKVSVAQIRFKANVGNILQHPLLNI